MSGLVHVSLHAQGTRNAVGRTILVVLVANYRMIGFFGGKCFLDFWGFGSNENGKLTFLVRRRRIYSASGKLRGR